MKNISLKGCRSQVPVASDRIPNKIKRSGLSFLLQPGPGPQIRSAQIRKQNSCTHTCLQPTHMARRRSDTYIPSEPVLICVSRPASCLLLGLERGAPQSIQAMQRCTSRLQRKKKSPEKNPEEPPPQNTHTLYTPLPPPSAPPPLGLRRSAYVVTNDTFIFLQRVCVCKTAEVHQDVKYFGWATQVALEDNQMEV